MKFIHLEQQSPAWHAWRSGGLGGSDVAAVMGLSPYCSREKLLREKLGLEVREENFAMRRGTRLEPVARIRVEKELRKAFVPWCVQHDDLDWIRVSLDGLYLPDDAEAEVLEIKCPSWQSHELALDGFVPDYYRVQCQYQLLATGLDVCHYASFSMHSRYAHDSKLQLAIIKIRPDAELQAEILTAAEEFVAEWEAAKRGGLQLAGAA